MFMGLFADMTLNGLTAVPRAALERAADLDLATRGFASQGLDDLLAGFGLGKAESLRWPIALVAAAAIAAIVFRHGPFRRSPVHIVSGIGIGAVIAAGWYMTGRIGADAFDAAPIESLTFVTPIGDTILYAVTYTGSTVNFGIGAVLGVVVGST
ncbi:MAG: YeeE/YedE thiosulfate transporter family protein, partial [Rhodospirillaceae bacterium]